MEITREEVTISTRCFLTAHCASQGLASSWQRTSMVCFYGIVITPLVCHGVTVLASPAALSSQAGVEGHSQLRRALGFWGISQGMSPGWDVLLQPECS